MITVRIFIANMALYRMIYYSEFGKHRVVSRVKTPQTRTPNA